MTHQTIDQLLDERGTVQEFRPKISFGPDGDAGRGLPILDAATLDGKPVPPRQFHVDPLIPTRTVTLLYGDGGTGKSLLSKQLAVATVLGRSWLGHNVAQGNCLFFTAEDDIDEVHRRLSDISASQCVRIDALRGLSILSLAGEDALLGDLDSRRNAITSTLLFEKIEDFVRAHQCALVVIDTLADTFGGDENNRSHARQFIGLLRGLAMRCETSVLLLAHPSLTGLNGRGASGSTAWSNSVRSRLYFERCKNPDNSEDDPDLRVLKTLKANYGPTGSEIRVRWRSGVFEPCDNGMGNGFAVMASRSKAERIFLELVAVYQTEGRAVGAAPAANYAPKLFASDQRSDGVTQKSLADAMNRLFASNKIKVDEVGPASKRRKQIVLVERD